MSSVALLRGASRRLSKELRKPTPLAVTTTTRSMTSDREKEFQEAGILDENRLLNFDTLHEMQVRACQVFEPKRLFGTYSEESNQFEFMSFGEFGQQVDHVRALLKDLGTLMSLYFQFIISV